MLFNGNLNVSDFLHHYTFCFRSAKAERSEKATWLPIEVNFKNRSAMAERKAKGIRS